MLRRIALVSLVLAVTAAAGLFAAGHLGVQLPWDLASTTGVGPGSKDREPAKTAEEAPAEAERAPEEAAETAEKSAETVIEETVAALTDEGGRDQEPAAGSVALDISRVSPDGPSVFAGRAEPGSYVTVFENGKPAGTVRADSSGSWSLSTEHKFAAADPKITFEASEAPPPAPTPASEPEPPAPAAETATPEESPPAAAAPAPAEAEPSESAPEVAGDVMRKFEALVSEAREDAAREKADTEARERAQAATRAAIEAQKKAEAEAETAERETVVAARPETPPVSEPERPAETAPEAQASASADSVPDAAGTVDGEAAKAEPETRTAVVAAPGRSASPEAAIPVPIMFVYNEATLTPEGERAADLLLEYLLLKRLDAVELTGHADERGTHAYNFDLSRERLEAVSRILKAGGYKGELKLTPKGKTEPFTGIDRAKYRGEALYQFDRRVELRVTR